MSWNFRIINNEDNEAYKIVGVSYYGNGEGYDNDYYDDDLIEYILVDSGLSTVDRLKWYADEIHNAFEKPVLSGKKTYKQIVKNCAFVQSFLTELSKET